MKKKREQSIHKNITLILLVTAIFLTLLMSNVSFEFRNQITGALFGVGDSADNSGYDFVFEELGNGTVPDIIPENVSEPETSLVEDVLEPKIKKKRIEEMDSVLSEAIDYHCEKQSIFLTKCIIQTEKELCHLEGRKIVCSGVMNTESYSNNLSTEQRFELENKGIPIYSDGKEIKHFTPNLGTRILVDWNSEKYIHIGFTSDTFVIQDFYYGTNEGNVSIDVGVEIKPTDSEITLPNLTTGLVGRWDFVNDATDTSGQENNGTVSGAIHSYERYEFDGNNDIITLSKLNLSDGDSFTVSAWVNFAKAGSTSTIISEGLVTALATDGFHLYKNTGNVLLFTVGNGTSGVGGDVDFDLDNLGTFAGNWYHVVGTFNNTDNKSRLYVNSELKDTSAGLAGGYSTYAALPPQIGRLAYAAAWYYNGSIDNVWVWNTSLSANEIELLFNETRFNTSHGTTYSGTFTGGVLDSTQNASTWDYLNWSSIEPAGTSVELRYRLGNYTCVDTSDNNLVNYWKLNHSAIDELGRNNGTIHGAVNVSGIFEKDGALHFDGTNDYVDIGNINLGTANVTMNIWAKLGVNSAHATLASVNVNSFRTVLVNGNDLSGWYCNAGQQSGFLPSINEWHMFTFTFNETNVSLYSDASLKKEWSDAPCNVAGQSYIGLLNPAFGQYFNGTIDSVTIYNRTLTAAEISDLYISWSGWSEYDSASPTDLTSAGIGKLLQYQARLNTTNNSNTPRLTEVNLTYEAETEIGGCQELNISGTTYVLSADIDNAPGDCMIIDNHSIILECQGHYIDGQNVGSGIKITGDYDNITIINCNVYNFITGIYADPGVGLIIENNTLINSSNCTILEEYNSSIIRNNSYYNCTDNAILLINESKHNRIYDNVINRSDFGIHVINSTNNTIYDNTLQGNLSSGTGIKINANNISIRNNKIFNFLENIVLDPGIRVTIENNTLENASNCTVLNAFNLSTVRNNTYWNCTENAIILVNESYFNNITRNTINFSYIGVNIINGSLNNAVWNNTFYQSLKAHANSIANNDFNRTVGNHWDDILSLFIFDTDGDGLGDAGSEYPYNNTNNANVTGLVNDYSPFTTRTPGPFTVNITLPINNSLYNTSDINISCTANSSDNVNNLTMIIWNADNTINQTNSTNPAAPNVTQIWNVFLLTGNYTAACNATNVLNQKNKSDNHTFRVDLLPPGLKLVSPLAGTIFVTTTTVTAVLTFQVNDTTSVNCSMDFDGKNIVNFTDLASGTYTQNQNAGLGTHSWNVTCVDEAGWRNSTPIWGFQVQRPPTGPTAGAGGAPRASYGINAGKLCLNQKSTITINPKTNGQIIVSYEKEDKWLYETTLELTLGNAYFTPNKLGNYRFEFKMLGNILGNTQATCEVCAMKERPSALSFMDVLSSKLAEEVYEETGIELEKPEEAKTEVIPKAAEQTKKKTSRPLIPLVGFAILSLLVVTQMNPFKRKDDLDTLATKFKKVKDRFGKGVKKKDDLTMLGTRLTKLRKQFKTKK